MSEKSEIFQHLIQDAVRGVLWRSEGELTLVVGDVDKVLRGKVVGSGQFWLRYAIPYHGPRHLMVVPGVFVAEQGGMLYGEQAWRFIYKNYQLYPRAEILGLRSDGDEVQVFMRELDLADTPRVLIYDNPQKVLPLGQLMRGIETSHPPTLPARARDLLMLEREE